MTQYLDNDGRLVTIDTVHNYIHKGKHFFFAGFITLGNPGTHRVKFVTPNSTTYNHFTWNISSSGQTSMFFYEGASDGMLGGTAITPLNSNRNLSGTSPMIITNGVTAASSNGTLLEAGAWGANGVLIDAGGESSRENEIVLKTNSTYLGVLISSTADNLIQFKANWYSD